MMMCKYFLFFFASPLNIMLLLSKCTKHKTFRTSDRIECSKSGRHIEKKKKTKIREENGKSEINDSNGFFLTYLGQRTRKVSKCIYQLYAVEYKHKIKSIYIHLLYFSLKISFGKSEKPTNKRKTYQHQQLAKVEKMQSKLK